MSDFRELRITITSNEVSFIGPNGKRFYGPPGFDDEILGRLSGLKEEAKAEDYGHELFQATFPDGPLRDGYQRIREQAEEDNARWRVRLDIPEDEERLHPLWWECLFDGRPGGMPLATQRGTLLSRFLMRDVVAGPMEAERLKMLVVISNPTDLGEGRWAQVERLKDEVENGIIEKALEGLEDVVDYDILTTGATLSNIRQRLRDEDVNVLHIVAHGSFIDDPEKGEKGVLLLEQDDEKAAPEDDERLGHLVYGLTGLKLVVLAACQGAKRSSVDPFVGLAPKMLYSAVDAVVAMQDLITPQTAATFTENFYRSLFTSKDAGWVDAAMYVARDQLFFASQKGSADWAVPVLFMRGEGQLFASGTRAETSEEGSRSKAPSAPLPDKSDEHDATRADRAGDAELDRALLSSVPKGARIAPDDKASLFDAIIELPTAQWQDEFGVICNLLEIPQDELEGDQDVTLTLALIERCILEDKVDRLWARIKARQRQIDQQQLEVQGVLRELRSPKLRAVS